jgi:hypothetical protein
MERLIKLYERRLVIARQKLKSCSPNNHEQEIDLIATISCYEKFLIELRAEANNEQLAT